MLSNEKSRAYYDKHGTVEGSDEDMTDMASFMDDLLNSFFGKGGSGGFCAFDDFDEFIHILEGGNDKATRKMFRELGRNARPGAGNRRKQAPNRGKLRNKKNKKKGGGMGDFGMGVELDDLLGDKGGGAGMEEMMMAMMIGDMMGGGLGGENDMEEAMAKEFAQMSKREREEMMEDMSKQERKEFN